MARKADVVWGIVIPDYVTNKDTYKAIDDAGRVLEESHITVENLEVLGLEPDGSVTPIQEEPNE